MKKILLSAFVALAAYAQAQNPIICDRYTADPAPYVYNDTLYLFVDHDGNEDTGYFNMPDWLLYTTTDMANWTYRGTPVTTSTFSWAKQGNDAWAAQCVRTNGKWYWYVTATVEGKGYPGVGVAVAEHPEGPYRDAIGRPLVEGWFYIDPTVIVEPSGAYLFWGNNNLWYGKLSSRTMTSISGITKVDTDNQDAFGPWKGYDDNGNPKTNFEEAPWIYKYGDKYYLEFAAGGIPEYWAYATADNINGPWTYQGRVMDSPQGSFTIHGGSIDYKGHSYMFYHDGRLPGGGGFKRSTSIEEFTRGADGSIPFIPFTTDGVAQIEWLDPYQWVEAETINQSEGIICNGGGSLCYVDNIKAGNWWRVKGVDFSGTEAKRFTVRAASTSEGVLQVRLGGRHGKIAARVELHSTGSLDNWQDYTVDLTNVPEGQTDVYFTFTGISSPTVRLDRWRFEGTEGIDDVTVDACGSDMPAYRLDGTKYSGSSSHPEVVIKNGKKVIVK